MRPRRGWATDYGIAVAAVAAVTAGGALLRNDLGLPAIALLYLLPVLVTATRGHVGAGLLAALGGALAYNFFLLPPRFTLQVHGYDNLVTLLVLLAVALVTSRLAVDLARREAVAHERAEASADAADLAAELAASVTTEDAERRALAFLIPRFGTVEIVRAEREWLNALDQAAAAWAADSRETTGHGTPIIAAADWTFAAAGNGALLAAARPGGALRSRESVEQFGVLARLTGQARDRLALEGERQERLRLEERDALLRTLLASLAHDLRTPLTVMRSAVEAGRLEELGLQIRRLERMLGDLLNAARIEAGSVGVAIEPVDLVDIVQAALEDSHAALARLDVAVNVAADLPLVRADPVLLRHILANLLDNGTRHATSRIAIEAGEESANVILRVIDDGPGIAPDQENAIFERFVSFAGDDRQGSGLGLAIVKGFADAMGMEVTAANRTGGGAAFTLVLPKVPGA